MNCRKTKKWLPLFYRDDLSDKQKKKALVHIRTCPSCREDLEKFRFSLDQIFAWMDEEKSDWKPGEWERILERAVDASEKKGIPSINWPFRRGWILASLLVFAVLLSVFVFQPGPVKRFLGTGDDSRAALQKGYASQRGLEKEQESFSLRMVAGESDLQIVWIFDKNFTLEENK
jgi:hypothetical protein